jgi:hypothetical protein
MGYIATAAWAWTRHDHRRTSWRPAKQPAAARYAAGARQTLALAAPLSEADCQVQSMPDASPVKWHLAHTTWFFETFVLERHAGALRPFNPAFKVLFNSYYNGVGAQHPRAQRGLVTRPDLAEVLAYRARWTGRWPRLLAHAAGRPELPIWWNWACSTNSSTRN